MSYDAEIIIHTGKDWVSVCDIGNYTSNVAPMFRAAIPIARVDGGRYGGEGLPGPVTGIISLSGLPCRDAAVTLREALAYFDANSDALRAMNPANGWGSYDGARHFLGKCLRACEDHPSGVFAVSW